MIRLRQLLCFSFYIRDPFEFMYQNPFTIA